MMKFNSIFLVVFFMLFSVVGYARCCPGPCCPNTNILNTKAEVITMKYPPKLADKLIKQAKTMAAQRRQELVQLQNSHKNTKSKIK